MRKEKAKTRNIYVLLGWTAVPVLLLVIWQIAADRFDQPWIFPPVSKVLGQLVHPLREHYASGSLLSNTAISMVRVLIGFTLAAIVGVSLGLLLGAVRSLRGLTEPLVEILRPLCPIAWLPFALVVFKLKTLPQLFGWDFTQTMFDEVQLGMIFVLFMGGFFPIVINTLDGVSGVRQNYFRLARILGANRRQSFVHVYLPAAMPMVLTGLRQGIGLCWFVIIAAEMMAGSTSGIGYLLMYASDNAAMDLVIAAMLIIGSIGALLNAALRRLTCQLVRWHGKET